MIKPYPPLDLDLAGDDRNPAIQLFGRRFFADQTIPELILEFLLVGSASKRVGDSGLPYKNFLIPLDVLRDWPLKEPLKYGSKARLNLKLFAFLSASPLETRHEAHREQYRKLVAELSSAERLSVTHSDPHDIVRTLSNLFLGFRGVGGQRTWCAQTLLPLCPELIAGESIWAARAAKKEGVASWEGALGHFKQSQHLFLARGGEALYLQLCNALARPGVEYAALSKELGLGLTDEEVTPERLHSSLERAIGDVLQACPPMLGKLANFVDEVVDPETARQVDRSNDDNLAKCGWIPEDTWRESILFTVEILRLSRALMDPLERLDLLETCCALQLLRTLCAQSARHAGGAGTNARTSAPLGYVWAVSDPEGTNSVVKEISRRSLKTCQQMIRDAIRRVPGNASQVEAKALDEADQRYGHKLFLKVAKSLGLAVPRIGPGARFVLDDRILRCLVLSLVRPGERVTFDTFKNLLYSHHGIAVDGDRLADACDWSGTSRLSSFGESADRWLVEMLEASGMLVRLSDACSLVKNPFHERAEES